MIYYKKINGKYYSERDIENLLISVGRETRNKMKADLESQEWMDRNTILARKKIDVEMEYDEE